MKNKVLKNFRTIASYTLALLVIVSSFGFVSVTHATGPTLTIGSQTALNSAHIVVPIVGSNFTLGDNIRGVQFKVNYDNTLLSYTGYAGATSGTTTINNAGNYINILWDHSSALLLNNETFVSLNFNVISSSTVSANLNHSDELIVVGGSTPGTTTFVDGVITLNPDTTPPTISLSYPADNATNVSINVQPTLTFSEALNQATVTNNNIELRDYSTNQKVSTALTYSEGNVVSLISSPLEYGKQYYFFVGTGVEDVFGNKLTDTWYATEKNSHEFTTEVAPLSSIAITTPATKLTYTVGDTLDISGLVITGTYSDTTTKTETITASNVTGFNSSTPVTGQVLTVTVGGKTATYTVNIVAPAPSSDKNITSFSFPEGAGVITGTNISVTVPFNTVVTGLIPTITVSAGASVSPNSGIAQAFTGPVTYTVTAADGSTQNYTVTVITAANSTKNITAFSFPEGAGVITGTDIAVTVPFGTNLTAIIPTISLSGGTVNPLSNVAQNFTSPVSYTVTAADNSTKVYTVTVTVAPNTEANILSFNSTSPVAIGVISGTDITLTVPFGTSLIDLPITISLSTGASVAPVAGNTTFVDGSAVIYTVTAQDGTTTKNYSVTATVAANTAKDITSFNFAGLTPSVVGVIEGNNITLNVRFGTNVTALVPTIGITGASISPASGVAQDFTSHVEYTVTAADTLTKIYTVTVIVADPSDLTAYNTALSAVNEADYTTASWIAYQLVVTINTVTNQNTQTEVATATLAITNAQSNLITHVAALASAKVTAHTALATAFATYNQANYTVANWTTLTGIKTAGDTAINAAIDLAGVTSAQDTAISGMAGVTTLPVGQIAPNDTGSVTVNSSTPEVVITNPTQAVTVTVSNGTTNATVNVSSFITGGTGTLPAITINSNNANVAIPASTLVTSADVAWNGIIATPTITTVTLPEVSGQTTTLGTAIEVGFSGAKLSFDKAVRILLPNQAGKKAGYSRTGTEFTEITNVCALDNQTTGDALIADGECKIDVGSDLVIWTKHFTTFASYTQTTIHNNSGGSSGSYTKPVAPTLAEIPGCDIRTTGFSTVTGQSCATNISHNEGKVLGADKFNFTKFMKNGSKGNEIIELQKFLTTLGYTLTADGNFGPKTKAAVIKFQIANGLKGDGVIGALTRATLNK